MAKPISEIRRQHAERGFTESRANADPFRQFDAWFDDVFKANVPDANAMTLATVGPDGRPAARVVLLKGFNSDGFVFYTNYESRKGRELAENPHAAACFWWSQLDRQVRIEGTVEKLSADESDAYFAIRPRESQLASWASQQSQTLQNRAELIRRYRELTAQYKSRPVPRPPHWGGFRLRPRTIEFWQGRRQRLHDRLRYRRDADGTWLLERLAP
jgi:pyridoxamine 5'-phosphate oxidase